MKYTKETYLKYDPFSDCDRDTDIRFHTEKIVKVRKEQDCMLSDLLGLPIHKIEIGQLARYDHALVDGEWGSYYSCLDCMDKWFEEDRDMFEVELSVEELVKKEEDK